MAVRNCGEMGENLQKIVSRLLANDNLVNLLYYSDIDPLRQPKLPAAVKQTEVFNKLIKFVPRVLTNEVSHGIVVITVSSGRRLAGNQEFANVTFTVEVFTPWEQWVIADENLRPFKILGEIEKSLCGKTINGLGKIQGGDFALSYLTDEMSVYKATYNIVTYD